MFIGLKKGTDTRVYIDDAVSMGEKTEFVCPVCNGELIVKNGRINASHFAHKSLEECDTFSSDMSEWHKAWQNIFPKRNQEVVLEKKLTNIQYEGAARVHKFSKMTYEEFMNYKKETAPQYITVRHRADVVACGYVIEFQHSPISSREFNERNWFYTECGYKVVWIFDFTEEYVNKHIVCADEWWNEKDNGAKYRWTYASKTFTDFVPQDHKPHYMDNKWQDSDIIVFFQLQDETGDEEDYIMEKVVWAVKEDNGNANFRRFMTSYYPGNKKELYEWVRKRKL